MSRTSQDPNRFGSNSAGLTAFVDEVLQLVDEQWFEVARARRDLLEKTTSELTAQLHSGDLAERSAVERLLDRTYQSLRKDLRAAGGRPLLMHARSSLWTGAFAIAFPETVDDEEFEVAVAPFVAVGIDCRALSQMGRVEA